MRNYIPTTGGSFLLAGASDEESGVEGKSDALRFVLTMSHVLIYLQVCTFFFNFASSQSKRRANLFAILYPVSLVLSILFALLSYMLIGWSACATDTAYGTVSLVITNALLILSLVSLAGVILLFWMKSRAGAQHNYAGVQ